MSQLLNRFSSKVFTDPEEAEAFRDSLENPSQAAAKALLWMGIQDTELFSSFEPFSWQPDFISRVDGQERPGAHELHDQGAYYVLDPSSVFAMAPVFQLDKEFPLILDLCASPGGKALLAYRRFSPELLVANEVIGKRTAQLISNLKRCKVSGGVCSSSDTEVFASNLSNTFPLVLVDAPCSGQSLLAKGKKSPGCFHPSTINMNSSRQRRILANAVKCLAPGGYLSYMTCTYSRKENEKVVEWLVKKFPEVSAVETPLLESYQSHLADFPCYRLWPHKGEGAGAFTCLLRKEGERERYERVSRPAT